MKYDEDKARQIASAAMEEIGKLIDQYNADLHKCGYILLISTTDIGQYAFDIGRLIPRRTLS